MIAMNLAQAYDCKQQLESSRWKTISWSTTQSTMIHSKITKEPSLLIKKFTR